MRRNIRRYNKRKLEEEKIYQAVSNLLRLPNLDPYFLHKNKKNKLGLTHIF